MPTPTNGRRGDRAKAGYSDLCAGAIERAGNQARIHPRGSRTGTASKWSVTNTWPLTVFYPGAGHTDDNIVVNIEGAGILFGRCLIRPGNSDNLGNTADGNVQHWATATEALAARFPDPKIVVPSHGPPAGRELFTHTIALAKAASAAK